MFYVSKRLCSIFKENQILQMTIRILFVICCKSYNSIQANKYDFKNRKDVTRKSGNFALAGEERVLCPLFWISFNENFLHSSSGCDFDGSNLVVSRRQMLHQDEKDDDHKGKKEAEEKPDIDEFHVGRCRQLRGDRLVEGVHHLLNINTKFGDSL